MRYVVGVDAGGTSTRAALVDETGTCWGYGRAGAGNPTSAGLDLAMRHFVDAVRSAIGDHSPDLVMLTLAGGLGHDIRRDAGRALHSAGLDVAVEVEGDVVSAYFSATPDPDGYLVLCGTGATGARITDGALAAVSDGIGWLLGDEGSGFWIGHRAIRAVAADIEQRGPATSMTAAVLAGIDASPHFRDTGNRRSEIWHLMRHVYDRRPVECAEFAPVALAAWGEGDPVALRIVSEAASGLIATCESIVADDDRPIVMAGGLLYDGSPLAQAIEQRYPGRCLRAADGTAGASLLALRHLGVTADSDVLSRIHESLRAVRR